MSAYIQGNLALNDRNEADADAQRRRHSSKQQAVRRKVLPAGEKLLYLFTVMTCCAVMGLMAYRYASIYEMNSQMVKMESEIQKLQEDSAMLKNQAAKLNDPERLIDAGIQLGLVPSGQAVKTLQEESNAGTVALGAAE